MADVSVTAGLVVPASTATLATGTSSGNITAGKVLYKDASDSYTLKLASDATSTSAAAVGIACVAASIGQPVTYVSSGSVSFGANIFTKGGVYTTSDTAGGIRPNADNGSGDYVTVVGIATATDTLMVSIVASSAAIA